MSENVKSCVIMKCDKKATETCTNCWIPVCDIHAKRYRIPLSKSGDKSHEERSAVVCVNCFETLSRTKFGRL
jgi:hypothetical protein